MAGGQYLRTYYVCHFSPSSIQRGHAKGVKVTQGERGEIRRKRESEVFLSKSNELILVNGNPDNANS